MEEGRIFDEKYEFHCPQFVDFAMPQTGLDDKADEYFEFDHETGQPIVFEKDGDGTIPDTFEGPSEDVPMCSEVHQDAQAKVHIQQSEPEPVQQRVDTHSSLSPVSEVNTNIETHMNERTDETTDNERPVGPELVSPKVLVEESENACTVVESVQNVTESPALEEENVENTKDICSADIRIGGQINDVNKSHNEDEESAIENLESEQMQETPPDIPAQEAHPVESETELIPTESQTSSELPSAPADAEEPIADVVTAAIPDTGEACPEEMALASEVIEEEERLEVDAVPFAKTESIGTNGGVQEQVDAVSTSAEMQEVDERPTTEEEKSQSVVPSNIVTTFDEPTFRAPSNIVTSWGNERTTSKPQTRKQTAKETRSRSTTRRSTRSLNNDSNMFKRATSDDSTQRRSLRIKKRNSDSPAIKRRRVSETKSQAQSSAVKLRKRSVAPPSKPFIAKLTLPTTPTCMKRNTVKPGTQFKTTEQMEMERIADFRRQLAERKKQAQASYKKVQESGNYQAKKAVIPTTHPEAFNFETDRRVKEHTMSTRQDAKSFEQNLRRSNPTSPTRAGPRGPTVAKPFKFTENRKRKFEEGDLKSPFVSMATKINQFQSRTPQRYHTRRSGDNNRTMVQQEPNQKPRLTCPKTPHFESKNRKRPVTVQSAAEKEELEVQEMKSYHFKANPVNPRVMSNLNVGLKMTSHKEPTKPIGFNLESEQRMKERERKHAEEEEGKEEHFEFHARPMPVKMLDGPVGLAEVKSRPLTCPKSPAFALKNRVRVKDDSIDEHEENKSHIVRANPVMHVGVPFKPQISHKTTEIQPFSFEQRDKEMKARKEAKIQEIYHEEERARHFKAKPILDNVALPEKKVKPATKQEPFKFDIEERSAKRAEEWSKKIEEELSEQRLKANQFKAKPADVLYHEPFVPHKPNKPLTEISGFDLNTDRRAMERENFEQWKLKKELEERERKHEQERLQEEEERQEVERMRREQMVHKAQPIKHYKPVHVQPSLRPLTEAQSPSFSDRFTK